ncbi:hypothetical protein AB1Y20_022022 [Prymnesium parvum]|uniref:phosphatidylinositol 3-kinase n=1 Tax=Prymnesium parvum TaxID=97485 RepID=A0AB34JEP9_PRYPA
MAGEYFLSSDVQLPVKLLVLNAHGSSPEMTASEPPLSYTDFLSEKTGMAACDMYVSCQLHTYGRQYGEGRTCNAPGSRLRWNEWVSFRGKYASLSPDAFLTLAVCGSDGPRASRVVGTARLALFDESQQLRTGVVKLRLRLSGGEAAEGEPAAEELEEMAWLDAVSSRHERVLAQPDPELDWLNRPTYAFLEEKQQDVERRLERHFISVQLPEFEYPVIFHERRCQLPPSRHVVATPRGQSGRQGENASATLHDAPIVLLADSEQYRDNPALLKHHKLARSLLSAGFAKELKPDAEERRRLAALVESPPTQRLREEERELMWKFRYSLTSEKNALTKFLKCVDWGDTREVQNARQLLQQWVPVDVPDLLELLGTAFGHTAPWVREFAVAALRERATDGEVLSYLLPLVQAVQYERNAPTSPEASPLAALLIHRAVANPELANFLHWYLYVERRDQRHGEHFGRVHDAFLDRLRVSQPGTFEALQQQEEMVSALSLAAQQLKASSESRPKRIQRLRAMIEQPGGVLSGLCSLQRPLMMPLNPTIRVVGTVAEKATVFKSAMSPVGLSFQLALSGSQSAAHASLGAHTPHSAPQYSIIFKGGDDLRQDQLVIQMLMLMDKLLREQGLDLKLTPYRVLATSPGEGLVERVPDCLPLAQVLQENRNDIRRYLQQLHPAPHAPYGIEPEVLETFVKSCAGYCVAMYVLGVGDRHLDNLMLRSNGALFHIDFGYILGRDPKPFPPPMKLCKEMVEAMGGADSILYDRFRLSCCEAFNILRASSNLILNLLLLMVDANVKDIKGEHDVLKVTEKFRLELSDEQAARYFQELINDSVSALFPQITETIHRWAQYWRS